MKKLEEATVPFLLYGYKSIMQKCDTQVIIVQSINITLTSQGFYVYTFCGLLL